MNKYELLKQHFGHSRFRPGQETLIDALLSGRDVLGVMPTGAGKSVCYQLPALLLPGMTVVVSPLISLMKDQVAALSQAGIPAAFLNSSQSLAEYRRTFDQAERGAYRILYVAPERLGTPDFVRFSREIELSLVAVDEAHCVSQWGQDFRPSYLRIAEFVSSLPHRPVVAAFTATATQEVKQDIERCLQLQDPLRVTTGFDRPNLHFEVARPKRKMLYLRGFLAQRPEQSGIIYCATRKNVETVCDELREAGISVTRYHAGLSDDERRQNQEDFVYDRAKVMVATNAFGMGIDKSNVSFVVHYNMPKNVESYYQEAGRAGRDGAAAYCVLLYAAGDVQTAKFMINTARENEALTEQALETVRQRDLQRLEQMVGYCKTTECLRAYLLDYFGEEIASDCGNCGNCMGEMEQQDMTLEAQKILSAVARVERKYRNGLGVTLIAAMLHGSRAQRVRELDLDLLPTYGILQDTSMEQIRAYIDALTTEGYLQLTQEDFQTLHTTPLAAQVLFQGKRVVFTRRKQNKLETAAQTHKEAPAVSAPADEGLLGALKALRTRLAQEENVPAYIIFTNAALADMAARQPERLEEFLQVSGVGEVKAARYGEFFLREIRVWKER